MVKHFVSLLFDLKAKPIFGYENKTRREIILFKDRILNAINPVSIISIEICTVRELFGALGLYFYFYPVTVMHHSTGAIDHCKCIHLNYLNSQILFKFNWRELSMSVSAPLSRNSKFQYELLNETNILDSQLLHYKSSYEHATFVVENTTVYVLSCELDANVGIVFYVIDVNLPIFKEDPDGIKERYHNDPDYKFTIKTIQCFISDWFVANAIPHDDDNEEYTRGISSSRRRCIRRRI